MYQSPPQNTQWAPASQAPPPQQQQQQPPPQGQQSPPNWSTQPPNGQYSNTPRQHQIPPITQAVAPPPGPTMATMQPQHPDQYRALPPPPHMYAPYPHPGMPYPPVQPAPRQRTAIACRYCRRRKIRCSGFDQAEDGRCTNCVRFSQECVFTPVSAQTQAFVPAHTVWRGHNPPPNAQLYGAYGQPLPQGGREPYPPQQQQGQYPPPPQGYQQPGMYQQPPQQQVGTPGGAGQKRSVDEPHTPTLPPPNPGAQAQLPRDGQFGGYPEQPPLAQPEQGEADGAAAAVVTNTTPMADGQARPEVISSKKYGVDAGVQVNLIGDEHVPSSKE